MPPRVEKPPLKIVIGQMTERLPAEQQAQRMRYIGTTVRQGMFIIRDQEQLSSTVADHLQELFPHLNYARLNLGAANFAEIGFTALSGTADGLIEVARNGAPGIPAGSTVCFESATPRSVRYIAPQHISRWSEDPRHGLRTADTPKGLASSGSIVVAPLRTTYDEKIYGVLVLVHGGRIPALEPLVASQYATELAMGIRALVLRGRLRSVDLVP